MSEAASLRRGRVVLAVGVCLSVWLGASCGRSSGPPDAVRQEAKALAAQARDLLGFLEAAYGTPGERQSNWPLSSEQDAWITKTWLSVRRDLRRLTSTSSSAGGATDPELVLASLRERITALRRAILPLRKTMTYAGGEDYASRILGDQDITDPPRAWREAESRLLRALSETLLDVVQLDIWRWHDGDTEPAGDLYATLGLFDDPSRCEQLSRYAVLVEMSRAPLGSRYQPSPEEEEAEPIRVFVALLDAGELHQRRVDRLAEVREPEVRDLSAKAAQARARERHPSIAADLEIVAASR